MIINSNPGVTGNNKERNYATLVVGHAASGYTLADADYLCDGTDDQEEINSAIEALSEVGGRVLILEGTYHLSAEVLINRKNIMLEGMGDSTVLSKEFDSSVACRIGIAAAHCKISNLYIDGKNNSGSGIYLSGTANTVTECTCNGNRYGIEFGYGTNNTATENICSNNYYAGIYIRVGENGVITRNLCKDNNEHGNSYGIQLSNTSNCRITGNTCCNNASGIYFHDSHKNTIVGNTCNSNREIGIRSHGSSNMVTGNTCNDNNLRGISVECSNSCITGNTCNDNTYQGILTSGSSNIITGNSCNGNESGIFLNVYSQNNLAASNLCLSNRTNITDVGTDNTLEPNTHINDTSNPHSVTADQAGAIPVSEKGSGGGVATLGSDGKIPSDQLPPMDYDPAGSAASVQEDLDSHKADSNLHTTAEKQSKWDTGAAAALEAKKVAEDAYELASKAGGGKKYATLVVGHAASGHTLTDVDYLCDGADDQKEINSAIQALSKTGGKVLILEGTYHLSAQITMNRSKVVLEGMGDNTVLSREFDGGYAYGIHITADHCKVCNLYAVGKNNDGSAIRITDASHNTITGCICNDNSYGILVDGGSNNTITENICSDNSGNGIFIRASNNSVITGNICSGSNEYGNSYGIYLYNSDGISITGNICHSNSSSIFVTNGYQNTIIGNICKNNKDYGIWTNQDSSSSSNNIIMGNICCGNGQYGIYLNKNNNDTITGNTCNDNASDGIFGYLTSNSNYIGNTCNDNIRYGIIINGNSGCVTGNICNSNSRSGVFIVTGSHSNLVTSNLCLNNNTSIIDDGTNNMVELNKIS